VPFHVANPAIPNGSRMLNEQHHSITAIQFMSVIQSVSTSKTSRKRVTFVMFVVFHKNPFTNFIYFFLTFITYSVSPENLP